MKTKNLRDLNNPVIIFPAFLRPSKQKHLLPFHPFSAHPVRPMFLKATGRPRLPQHAGRDAHTQVQTGHVVLLGVALEGMH